MTETSGGLAYDGVPLPGAAFRIDDATGRIEVTGPMLARGYLGDDAATAEAFVDGWHRTLDAGRVADGRLEVLGRLDDVVQVGGVNVAVTAVEDVLAPLCGGVVVLAEPDDRWGARLTAYVVQPGTGRDVADLEALGAAVGAQPRPGRRAALVGAARRRTPAAQRQARPHRPTFPPAPIPPLRTESALQGRDLPLFRTGDPTALRGLRPAGAGSVRVGSDGCAAGGRRDGPRSGVPL